MFSWTLAYLAQSDGRHTIGVRVLEALLSWWVFGFRALGLQFIAFKGFAWWAE